MKFYLALFLVLIIICLLVYLLSTFEEFNIFVSKIKKYIINSRSYKHFMIVSGRLFRLSIVASIFSLLLFLTWVVCISFYIVVEGVFFDKKTAIANEPVIIEEKSQEVQSDPNQNPIQNERRTNNNGRIRVKVENDWNMT